MRSEKQYDRRTTYDGENAGIEIGMSRKSIRPAIMHHRDEAEMLKYSHYPCYRSACKENYDDYFSIFISKWGGKKDAAY
jgi:hypothetical protein